MFRDEDGEGSSFFEEEEGREADEEALTETVCQKGINCFTLFLPP